MLVVLLNDRFKIKIEIIGFGFTVEIFDLNGNLVTADHYPK